MWIVIIIVVVIAIIGVVYYFFFSTTAKKKSLVNQIMTNVSGKNGADTLDSNKLMQQDIPTLQGILDGTVK